MKILSRQELLSQLETAELVHSAGSIAQPDVYWFAVDNLELLAKDYRKCPAPLKFIARKILRHEEKILCRLANLNGIPAVYESNDPDILLMQYIAGPGTLVDSREIDANQYPPVDFFQSLHQLLDEMHNRGIAHGDIRRKNILISSDGRPYLVDFATAVYQYDSRAKWRSLLYNMFKRSDRTAMLKIKKSYYPDTLSKEERRILHEVPIYLAIGKFMRKKIYRPFIKQRTWKKRLKRLTAFFARGQFFIL